MNQELPPLVENMINSHKNTKEYLNLKNLSASAVSQSGLTSKKN